MLTDDLKSEMMGIRPTPADYLPIARKIDRGEVDGLRPLRVGLLASFTAEPLAPYIVVESGALGIECTLFTGPYNQFETLILNLESELYQVRNEIIVIAMRLEETAPELCCRVLDSMTAEEAKARTRKRFEVLITGIRERSDACILIWNFADPRYLACGLADPAADVSQADMIRQTNRDLACLCQGFSDVFVFDLCRLAAEHGLEAMADSGRYFLDRMPYGDELSD